MPTADLLLRTAAALVTAYLLGAIPSGVLVSKLGGKADPRAHGSGKTGATNVLRTQGASAAALVVILDLGKGMAAVLFARLVFFGGGEQALAAWRPWVESLAGLAALVGHNYSIYIRFTGGRGVLTGLGASMMLQPIAAVAGLLGGIVPVLLTRYVSLGSILGSVFTAVADAILVFTGHDVAPHLVYFVLGAAFVILSHHDNIDRLRHGTERKLGQPAR